MSTEEKARRYLRDGRVRILEVTVDLVAAEVEGSGDRPYRVVWTLEGGWRCTCPAFVGCSHRHAVMMVTAPGAQRPVLTREVVPPPLPPPPDEEPMPAIPPEQSVDRPRLAAGDQTDRGAAS